MDSASFACLGTCAPSSQAPKGYVRPPRPPWDWLLVVLLAIGALIRLHRIGDQVLVGDEPFAVQAAAQHGFAWLAANLELGQGKMDFGPALGLYARAVATTLGLDEWTLRLPFLLAGIVLPWCLVRCLAPVLDRNTLRLAVALVVFSPALVHHSRFARPYGVIALLELAATWSLWQVVRFGSWRAGVLHAFTAAASLYLNASSGVFLAALWAAALVWIAFEERGSERAKGSTRVVVWATAGVGGALLLYAPAIENLAPAVLERVSSVPFSGHVLRGGLEEMLGTPNGLLVALLGGLALVGLGRVALDSPGVGLAVLVLLALPTSILLVFQPQGLFFPPVFVRYQIGNVVLLLVLVAIGAVAALHQLSQLAGRAAGVLTPIVGTAVVLGLVAAGPLPATHGRINDFGGVERLRPIPPAPFTPPLFYASIADKGPPGAVAEVPWHPRFSSRIAAYQRIHGRPVIVVADHLITLTPGFRFRKLLPADLAHVERNGASWLVVHRDPASEDRFFDRTPPFVRTTWPPSPDRIAREAWRRYGKPVYQDRWILVFRVTTPERLGP